MGVRSATTTDKTKGRSYIKIFTYYLRFVKRLQVIFTDSKSRKRNDLLRARLLSEDLSLDSHLWVDQTESLRGKEIYETNVRISGKNGKGLKPLRTGRFLLSQVNLQSLKHFQHLPAKEGT